MLNLSNVSQHNSGIAKIDSTFIHTLLATNNKIIISIYISCNMFNIYVNVLINLKKGDFLIWYLFINEPTGH